jgi:hypothetical protein
MLEENLDIKLDEVNRKIAETTQQVTNLPKADIDWWSTSNAMTMSSAVLGFGIFVILIAAFLVRSGKSAESVLRIFGTILIIIASLFLVVAGYDSQQIAPVMGLLGTIAGYLLGKESKDS